MSDYCPFVQLDLSIGNMKVTYTGIYCKRRRFPPCSIGFVSVLKPKATVKACAVPLSHGSLRRPRILPSEFCCPPVRRPRARAMPSHTSSGCSVSKLSFGNPALQVSLVPFAKHKEKAWTTLADDRDLWAALMDEFVNAN